MLESFTDLPWNADFPFLTFFAPAFGLAWWWVKDLWDREERKHVVLWLKYDRSRYLYQHLIKRVLDAASSFLGRREARIRTGPGWDETKILDRNKRPWSWGLFEVSLLLAVSYPILSLIIQWSITGIGEIESLAVFPDVGWDERKISAALVLVSAISVVFGFFSRSKYYRIYFLPAILVYFWMIIEYDAAILNPFFAGIFFGIIIAAKRVVYIYSGVFLLTMVCVISSAGALLDQRVVAPRLIGMSLIFGMGVVLSEIIRSRLEQRIADPTYAVALWVALLFAVLVVATSLPELSQSANIKNVQVALLFLGFLPLLNAVADFASTGLTRYFLARGASEHRLLRFGGIDIVAGSATFFGLGFAMIGTVALVKGLDGPELIDFDVLLGDKKVEKSILKEPHSYWWLYLTFLSTLLPTVIHGFIATFAFFVMWPTPLRNWLATSLDSGSYVAGRPACLALAALIALSVALPLTLLYYLGWALAVYYPNAGETLIEIFRWFAELTGAI